LARRLRARRRPVQPLQSFRILSVEDNPFGRVVLNTILSELGHQAPFVSRGEDATDRVAGGTFDAVLMDMVLPGINASLEVWSQNVETDLPERQVKALGQGKEPEASRFHSGTGSSPP
jgi:two-component system, sensor histidine kinase